MIGVVREAEGPPEQGARYHERSGSGCGMPSRKPISHRATADAHERQGPARSLRGPPRPVSADRAGPPAASDSDRPDGPSAGIPVEIRSNAKVSDSTMSYLRLELRLGNRPIHLRVATPPRHSTRGLLWRKEARTSGVRPSATRSVPWPAFARRPFAVVHSAKKEPRRRTPMSPGRPAVASVRAWAKGASGLAWAMRTM